jgi:hypothetical protein
MSRDSSVEIMACYICHERHDATEEALDEHMQQRHPQAWNTRDEESQTEVSLHSRQEPLNLMTDC